VHWDANTHLYLHSNAPCNKITCFQNIQFICHFEVININQKEHSVAKVFIAIALIYIIIMSFIFVLWPRILYPKLIVSLGAVPFIILDGSFINNERNIKVIEEAFDITIPNGSKVESCTFYNGRERSNLVLTIHDITDFNDFISNHISFSIDAPDQVNDYCYVDKYYKQWTVSADCYKSHPHDDNIMSEIYMFHINGKLIVEVCQDNFNSKKLASLIYSKGWNPNIWKEKAMENTVNSGY